MRIFLLLLLTNTVFAKPNMTDGCKLYLNSDNIEQDEIDMLIDKKYIPVMSQKRYARGIDYIRSTPHNHFALKFRRSFLNGLVEDNYGLDLVYKTPSGLITIYRIGDGIRNTDQGFINNLPDCKPFDLDIGLTNHPWYKIL